MTPGILRRAAGLLLAGGLLSACATLGRPEPVQVNVIGMEPLPGEGMELRMAVQLRVQNPNDTALDFDGLALELDLNGSPFATGVSAEHGTVPRFGEAVVTVPVSISALSAVRQALDLATHDRRVVGYALRGRLAGAAFGGLRFESKGEIDMPQSGWNPQ